MSRRVPLAVLVLTASWIALSAQQKIEPRVAEAPFSRGGHVWMELSSGNYEIRAGREDRVFVELRTSDPDDVASLKTTIERKGRDLLVVTDGARGSLKGVIEVPAETHLNVRLSAGDLRLRGVRGSKDIRSWAGDIDIEMGPRGDYRRVHASVTAGDLKAAPFDVTKGGLFRSFNWEGKGTNTADIRLTAGNLTLR
jgi:hypothetical protein